MGGPPGSDDVKIGKLSICVELCVGDVMTPCRDHDVEYSMIEMSYTPPRSMLLFPSKT